MRNKLPLSVDIVLLVCHDSRAALKKEHKRTKKHSAVFDTGQQKQKVEKNEANLACR